MSSDGQCEPGLQELVCLRTLIVDEDLIAELAGRSEFLKTQLECVGDAGAVQVPVRAGKLWVTCLLRTPAALRATDDATLVKFLKAAAFFHDVYMVQTLCGVLGDSLRDAASSEQKHYRNTERITLVLEALSVDVAIDVLRSMPGSFLSNFANLPQSLKPLAALAEFPGLAAACVLSTEGSGGSDRGLPTLTLCVDASDKPHRIPGHVKDNSGTSADGSNAQDDCQAAMWLGSVEVTQDNEGSTSVLCVEPRAGTIGCCLPSRAHKLHGVKIKLPANACLVFGQGSGGMHLKDCTFKGGSIVCMGTDCSVTFEDCSFDHCSVVAVSGGQATLRSALIQCGERDHGLQDEPATTSVSVLANGHGTRVAVDGGVINGGAQGVAVQGGAQLDATGLHIFGVQRYGVEVKGEGSSAKLEDCRVVEAGWVGVMVGGGGVAKLARCTLSICSNALQVRGPGSHAEASHCEFLGNLYGGVYALEGCTIQLMSCSSSGNGSPAESGAGPGLYNGGFEAREDAVLELSQCSSDADYCACIAAFGGRVVAWRVTATRSTEVGFLAAGGGSVELHDCSTVQCLGCAALAVDGGSVLDAEGCTFSRSGELGVRSDEGAVVVARKCSTVESGMGGFFCCMDARMTVSNSSSMGDAVGFSAAPGGAMRLLQVSVDGVRKPDEEPALGETGDE